MRGSYVSRAAQGQFRAFDFRVRAMRGPDSMVAAIPASLISSRDRSARPFGKCAFSLQVVLWQLEPRIGHGRGCSVCVNTDARYGGAGSTVARLAGVKLFNTTHFLVKTALPCLSRPRTSRHPPGSDGLALFPGPQSQSLGVYGTLHLHVPAGAQRRVVL
jgi:hypothetical protein